MNSHSPRHIQRHTDKDIYFYKQNIHNKTSSQRYFPATKYVEMKNASVIIPILCMQMIQMFDVFTNEHIKK